MLHVLTGRHSGVFEALLQRWLESVWQGPVQVSVLTHHHSELHQTLAAATAYVVENPPHSVQTVSETLAAPVTSLQTVAVAALVV